MFQNPIALLTSIEIQVERQELRELGLTEDEIDGYFEYYMDNYLPDLIGVQK